MAECVSCGKEIPAGKFFCEECYRKMKGRKGVLGEVKPPPAAAEGGTHPAGGTRPAVPAAGAAGEKAAVTPGGEKKESAGEVPGKKVLLRGELTPPSKKKVVSLKPAVEKPDRKTEEPKKRFRVTITFSERTYNALARLRGGRRGRKGKSGGGELIPMPEEGRRMKHTARGKPRPAAAGKARKAGAEPLPRRGKWDGRDWTAAVFSTAAAALCLALPFFSWIKLEWVIQDQMTDRVIQSAVLEGLDLGAAVYVIMGAAALSWLYMVVSGVRGGKPLGIDFGVVLILAGILLLILLFFSVAPMQKILSAAAEKRGLTPEFFDQKAVSYSRHTFWPPYLMVFLGCLISFSGLVHLSERKSGAGS
jgi:glycerol-3-phosphate acyltransferase PlsY